MKNKQYGWIPDLPDHRDFSYSVYKPKIAKFPNIVDLRKQCSPIENQKELGSCTANALVGTLEFLEIKNNQPYADLSRLFVYYNERMIEHTVKQDSGAMLRDGIKSLNKQGVCLESDWKYDINKFKIKPSQKCYREALQHTIVAYHRLNTLDDMLNCLATSYPFVFGFTVYESFESDKVVKTGIVPMPHMYEKALGGHAVSCFGYNNTKKMFYVRNSWGIEWGQKGYCEMPYDYLTNRDLSNDFWTIQR